MSSFFPTAPTRMVPGHGDKQAKIVLVGDYTTIQDDRALRPFVGPNGSVLEQCLHGAGLITGEVYLTNIFKSRTTFPDYRRQNTDFFDENKKTFTPKGKEHRAMLLSELDALAPNIIVTLGIAPTLALTGISKLATYRGYVYNSTGLAVQRKVIPTFSPGSTIRGNYVNRFVIQSDLRKAKQESSIPELIRPDRKLLYSFHTVEEVLQWMEVFYNAKEVSFDIEVINYEISCISFSLDPSMAVVIPIGESELQRTGWTELEELQIWRAIQRVLGNPASDKIVQNGAAFDIPFMLMNIGMTVRGKIKDTMIGHHVAFPDLPKGLGFLGSIYCGSQEYWKDAVKWENIKEES